MFKNEKSQDVDATIPHQEKPNSLVAMYAKQAGPLNETPGREEPPTLIKKVQVLYPQEVNVSKMSPTLLIPDQKKMLAE